MGLNKSLNNLNELESENIHLKRYNNDLKKIEVPNQYKKIMKLPLKIALIFGLYHKKKNTFGKVYSVVVLIALWLNIIKILPTLVDIRKFSFTMSMQIKICNLFANFIIVFQATVLFLNQEVNKREQNLIVQFNYLLSMAKNEFSQKKVKFLTTKLNFIFILATLFGLFHSCLVCLAVIYRSFSTLTSYSFQIISSGNLNIFYRIFIAMLESFSSFYLNLSIAYFSSHCIILKCLFDIFNKEFKLFIKNSIVVSCDKSNCIDHGMVLRLKNQNSDSSKIIETEEKFEYYRLVYLMLKDC